MNKENLLAVTEVSRKTLKVTQDPRGEICMAVAGALRNVIELDLDMITVMTEEGPYTFSLWTFDYIAPRVIDQTYAWVVYGCSSEDRLFKLCASDDGSGQLEVVDLDVPVGEEDQGDIYDYDVTWTI